MGRNIDGADEGGEQEKWMPIRPDDETPASPLMPPGHDRELYDFLPIDPRGGCVIGVDWAHGRDRTVRIKR